MPNKDQYAKSFLIGGLAIGILSGVPGVSCLCCLWPIAGGAFAAYLLCRWARYPVSEGEGALVGLISGVIGAVVATIFYALQVMVSGGEQYREAFEQARRNQQFQLPPGAEEMFDAIMDVFAHPAFLVLIVLIFFLFFFSLAATAGGFLGVTLFGKKKPPLPPGGYGAGIPTVNFPPPMPPPPYPGPPPASGKDDSGFFFPR